MKNIFIYILLLVVGLCVGACERIFDYDPPPDNPHYNETWQGDNIVLSSVRFSLSPYMVDGNENKSIVTDSLFDIEVAFDEAIVSEGLSSFSINTSAYVIDTIGVYGTCSDSVQYPVILRYRSNFKGLSTAGEFEDALDNAHKSNGDLFFRILSFKLKDVNGDIRKVSTQVSKPITIHSRYEALYVGNFNVLVQ